jgi:hypothetical protein
MSDLKKAAVDLAKRGYWIFPCREGEKIPAIPGFLDVRMTVEEVEAFWTRRPKCNIGMNPETNKLVMLDLDLYKDECTWDKDVPETMMVRSASGGEHHYFNDGGHRYPGRFNGYEGVDIKHRGVAVLPPSKFEKGTYEWVDEGDAIEIPDWMPTRVVKPIDPMAAALLSASRGDDVERLIEIVQRADNTLEDRQEWLAVGLGLHFEAWGTPHSETARDAFIEWSRRWEGSDDKDTLELEAIKLWDYATDPIAVLQSGRKPYTGGSVRHFLKPKPPEQRLPEPPTEGLFRKFDGTRDMSLRPWVIENILREGEIGGVSGGPGTGKTNVTATWIAGMLAGDGPTAGLPPVARPLNVAWVNAEEDVNALDLRVLNALRELGLSQQAELYTAGQETLIGESFDGTSLVSRVNRESVINLDLVAKYIEELKGQKADILILDPVTEFNDGEENDRVDTKKLFRAMKTMAGEVGLTVLYFAHTAQTPEGKREDWYRGNLYAQRGSSAAVGALQFGATLTPMYPAGVKGDDAREWREQQADASDDRVPNIVEMVTIKSKMGTAKPKLYYEIRQSTYTTVDGQHLPFAEPITAEVAHLRIEGAKDSNQELIKSSTAVGIVKRLGEGAHHNATKLHAQLRGVYGWPDIEKLDLSKGAGAELLKTWVRAMQVTVDDVVYRVSISRKDSGPKEERFRIVVEAVG